MLVYGDPTSTVLSGCLLRRLDREARLTESNHPDDLRDLLITAGQLEQGVLDLPSPDPWLVKTAMRITDQAAAIFLGAQATGPLVDFYPGNLRLRIKSPEGFAHYALFPEQYAQATTAWTAKHADRRAEPVIVVGVRSIGTTLSAVVAQALKAQGWTVQRFTVRPTGHPYDRCVSLPGGFCHGNALAIVVDEGPGRSGSSMAATAQALLDHGFDRSQISFFPGHCNGPGPEASAAVRQRWREIPSYTASLSEVKWRGQTLHEILSPQPLEDLSAGKWRRAHFADPGEWPPVWAPFERTKFRAGSVLWKFCGFSGAAQESATRLAALAGQGWTGPALRITHGFLATPWLDGAPLQNSARREPQMLSHLGRYIAAAAGPPLSPQEATDARERLVEVLRCNAPVACSERFRSPHHSLPRAGDGRLGPVEWLRDRAGRILKVDCQGHDADHTICGPQPVLWDLAGAIVEWRLDRPRTRAVLDAFHAVSPARVRPADLTFYRRAYAAFRLGQSSLCAGLVNGPEQHRLRLAEAYYLSQLRQRE